MRTFTKLAICLALLTATVHRAHAQETFAPLISENCVAFIHVDLRKIDIDTVKAALQKTGENLLRQLGFDEQSFNVTARELGVELEKLDMIVRPTWEKFTKEIGITEIALIADLELLALGVPLVEAVPWKNKTDEQLQMLHTLLHSVRRTTTQIGDLLLLTCQYDLEEVTNWANSLLPAPADSTIHEALASVADADIKVALALPEQLRAMAQSGLGFPPDMPNEVRGLIMFAAQRVQWASAAVYFQDFLGGEPREDSDVLLTIKTARAADARMLRGMMEQAIDLGVNSARFAMEQQTRDADFQIPPLAFSFARGFLRTLLPDVEEDKLIFRVKSESQAAFTAVSAGSFVFLPVLLDITMTTGVRERQQVRGLQQVSGTIMFSDGTPLPTGVLVLESPTFVAQADVQPDGTYTFVGNIPDGSYRVFIRGAESLIDPRYQNADTTGLSIDIRGRTTFDATLPRHGERR